MDLDKIIKEAVESDFSTVYPIGLFSIEDLGMLSKKAHKANVNIRIETEYSNFYQGTLIKVQRAWETVEEKLDKEYSQWEIEVKDHRNDKVAYKKLGKNEAARLNSIVNLKWE